VRWRGTDEAARTLASARRAVNHAGDNSPVSLQVDRFDWFHRTGWSVLVHGVAELVDPDLAGALIEEGDDTLDTWAPGDQPVLVRVRVEYLSGRRIELQQIPLDGRGYL